MTRLGRYTLGLACLSLLALIAAGCGKQPAAGPATTNSVAAQPEARPGNPAPEFTLAASTGEKIALSSLKGKPVVVIFWASWCHFCAQEAPDLEALYTQYRPQGLQVLGVGTDDEAAIVQKAKELKLTYPIGSDPAVAQTYGVGGVPHTFIIDKEGKISASLAGARPKDEMEAEIRKVL
jgi:peroxiredoxin